MNLSWSRRVVSATGPTRQFEAAYIKTAGFFQILCTKSGILNVLQLCVHKISKKLPDFMYAYHPFDSKMVRS